MLENWLIQAVIEEGNLDKVQVYGVSEDLFKAPVEKESFKYLLDYFGKYGSMPNHTVLKNKTKFEVVEGKPKSPLQYFIDELFNRELFNALADQQAAISDAMRKRDPKLARELMEKTVQVTSSIIPEAGGGITYKEIYNSVALKERIDRYEKIKFSGGIDGIPTAWPWLDDVTYGWHEEELIIVAARAGTGKTWFLLLNALAAWKAGNRVLFVTFEMADAVIGRRLDSLMAGIPYSDLRKGRLDTAQEKDYKKAMKDLNGKEGFVVMNGGWASTPAQLESVINLVNPDIVFVDGLYFMMDGLNTREPWQRNLNVADQIKQLTQRVGPPIIASVQFNRNVNLKKLKGGLESVGGSDRFVQNADIVIGLFTNDELRDEKMLMVRLLKMREDDMLSRKINWNFDTCDFSESSDPGEVEPEETDDYGKEGQVKDW